MPVPRLMKDFPVTRDDLAENTITLTDETETTLHAAVAGTYLDLSLLMISNSSASKVQVAFRDTTGGSERFTVSVAPDGGGNNPPFKYDVKQTTANTNWTAKLSTSVSSILIFSQAVKHVA